MKPIFISAVFVLFFAFCGCNAVYNANRAPVNELQSESTIVFTRPARFSPVFGSYSINELVEITYERASRNEAGQLVVEAGIRYRGPVSWTNWFKEAPSRLTLRTVCNFYQDGGIDTPVVYSTNHREIVIRRGETFAFKAVCPVNKANRYQIVLGD